MKHVEMFRAYCWLVNLIASRNGITLNQICEEWRNSALGMKFPISDYTMRRYIDAIEDVFSVKITCRQDAVGWKYRIENDFSSDDTSVKKWLFYSLTVSDQLFHCKMLQDRIQVESMPCVRHLDLFLEAAKKNQKVCICYQKFGGEKRTRVIEPYVIKTYRHRWYVRANVGTDVPEFRTYALDRILEAELMPDKFKMEESFSAFEHFKHCYGVMNDTESEPVKMVLRAYGNEACEVETLPLHRSQVITDRTEEYVELELFMKPSKDFLAHVLSRGGRLEILKPENLRAEITEMALEVLKNHTPA